MHGRLSKSVELPEPDPTEQKPERALVFPDPGAP